MGINLTAEQQNVVRRVVGTLKGGGDAVVTLGGFAGTGKSTIVSFLVGVLNNYAVCAYTGKAANVLRTKGVASASTIHSLIYVPVFEDGDVHWELSDELPCDGIIVDEASMVSREIYHDLRSFKKPTLFVGDHGQLEPVGSDFNVMERPDHTLETIHRNAGDIARFAEHLRFGKSPRDFRGKEDKVAILRKWDLTPRRLAEADQVICAFNKTRVETNDKIRKYLGFGGPVGVGEKVMCLRNNKKLCIFNGMQGTVKALYEDGHRHFMDFESNGTVYPFIRYDPSQFGKETAPQGYDKDGPNPFDFANCITCHKSQGDQFGRVIVIEQKCSKWDHKRWGYTGASRAVDDLGWAEAS